MTDNKPAEGGNVTKAWQATQDQKSAATNKRIFAALCWAVAIGGEIAALVLLHRHKFDHGNTALLLSILVGIALFAMIGSTLWKQANQHDPAHASDPTKFFFQNQLGAIVTVLAFAPLLFLILRDKDMDPETRKVASGVGLALAVLATVMGINFKPASVEQYTQDMTACAAQIKAGQPTTACSPDVAAQAQDIAKDSAAVADATKDADHPAGQDVVYWIAPENGAKKAETAHVFHLCDKVSPLKDKTINHGSVTEAYAQNATRITKQIEMEQKQCGLGGGVATPPAKPAGEAAQAERPKAE